VKESYAIRVYKEYFNFASSHFLIFADGTREPLHGHNYQVQVRAEGDIVEGDLVIDFIPFKPLVKRLCDDLDHCMLLPDSNPHLRIETDDKTVSVWHRDGGFFQFPKEDVRILNLPNTSTEMLARHLGHRLVEGIRSDVPLAKIHSIEVQVEESSGQCGICRIDV
jgi:6-pyruvoyltetrahydropterin/6-carboxytetrahydropterin synthase